MKSGLLPSFVLLLAIAALHVSLVAQDQTRTQTSKTKPSVVASAATLISAPEQAVIDEINMARTNPSAYVKFLEDFKKYYRGKEIHYPDGVVLVTIEGGGTVDEAIAFMRTLKPMPPLELRPGMVLAAKDHLNDLVKTGRSGHTGSDGSKAGDRFDRYGSWLESLGEDIVYFSRAAREDVISLIIDDGTSTRGHRKNIFQQNFRVVGIALSAPKKSGTVCVITFAGGYKDKDLTKPKTTTPAATKF